MTVLLLLFFLLVVPLLAQNPNTADFPGAISTDTTLGVASRNPTTTLRQGIDSVTTTIILVNASDFLEKSILTIDNEEILVCTKSVNTFTVCPGGRGFNGTTSASHSQGRTVRNLISSHYINQAAAEIKALEKKVGPTVTVATLPSSPSVGDKATVTDGSGATPCTSGGGSAAAECFWNGSSWVDLGGGAGGDGVGYDEILDEGSGLTKRAQVNFIGATISCVDNPGATRTDCTSNAEEETHATEHQHAGNDEVATATPAANAIPKAGAGGTLAAGWIQEVIAPADLTGVASVSGNGTALVTTTGAQTAGDCVEIDVNGNHVAAGAACGTGGGGDEVTVNGAATTNIDLDDDDPAAPSEGVNVDWQLNTTPSPDSASANVPFKSPLSKTGGALDLVLAVDAVSSTQIRLGANCSATNPCNGRIGNKPITLQNSCTCTITGGTENGTWGWEISAASGNFVCWHNITETNVAVAGTGCVENDGQSAFNGDNVPLASDSITTGAFTFSALSDKRGPVGRDVVIPGTAITVTVGADGRRTVAYDVTASPAISGNPRYTSYVDFAEITPPGNPAANDARFYAKDDATVTKLCYKDSAGTETCIGAGGSTYQLVSATNDAAFNPHWQFTNIANANVTNFTGGSNTVHLVAFSVPGGNEVVTADVTFQIQTADAAGTMEIGVYNQACTSILAQTGAMTTGVTDSTGYKNVVWSGGSKTLSAGRYWLAVTTNSATLAWRSYLTNDFWNGLVNQTGGTRMSTGSATTGGVLNATCGSRTANGSSDPIALIFE